MNLEDIIKKLKQVQLSIYAHPDREPNSEFADCVDSLGEVISDLSDLDKVDEFAKKRVEGLYNS